MPLLGSLLRLYHSKKIFEGNTLDPTVDSGATALDVAKSAIESETKKKTKTAP